MVVLLTLLSCSQRHQYSFAPGDVVPDNVLDTMDINTRFVCLEIPDTVFDLMCGRSYKDDCILSRSDLRYLLILHRNLEGKAVVGEMVVNKEIAADVLDIMEELFLKSYPIERVRRIHRTRCICFRNMQSAAQRKFLPGCDTRHIGDCSP